MCGISFEKTEIDSILVNVALELQKEVPFGFKKAKKKIIVLSGPTCCGKTKTALKLAQAINGEIISADSMQVYRHMDIGTAKVTVKERLEIPHHLIDIRDVADGFNVVDFYYEAHRICKGILDRGSVPIVVGGSGFYLHTFLYGPPKGPPSVPEVRRKLEDELDEYGQLALYDRLMRLDPQYAKSITNSDKHKIVRALEIMTLTNGKVSTLSWKGRPQPHPIYDYRCWFLYQPREKLYERIEKRCDQMLEDGFLDEVKWLLAHGIDKNPSATQAIGYRQAIQFLQTQQTEDEYIHFVNAFKQATRNYAKRQMTWFRKEPDFRWLDVDLHDIETVFDIIVTDFESC